MTRRPLAHDEWLTLLIAFLAMAALFIFSAWHDTLPVLPPLPDNAPAQRTFSR